MFNLNDWYLSGSDNSFDLMRDAEDVDSSGGHEDETLIVRIESLKPSYLTYRRKNARFGSMPTEAAISATPDSWTFVSVDIDSAPDSHPRLGATVYLQDANGTINGQKTWGSASSLAFYSPMQNCTNSVYIRFDRPGTYKISKFEIHTSLQQNSGNMVTNSIDLNGFEGGGIQLSFNSQSEPNNDATMLVTFEWENGNGDKIAAIPDRAINPKYGPYEYLNKYGQNDLEVGVPNGAVRGRVNFIPWKPGRSIFVSKSVKTKFVNSENIPSDSKTTLLHQVLSGVPSDKKIIVLHTTAPPLGHSTLSLRPNRLAVEFEAMNAYVIFLPFSTVPEGIIKYQDNSIVVCRSLWPVLQLELAKRKKSDNVFVCTSFPNYEAISALDLLGMCGWETVYEIRDDMEEFNRVGYSKWYHPQLEKYVAERANKVVAVSPRLANKANVISSRGDAIVSPNAVSDFLFEAGLEHRTIEFQSQKEGSKIVGYLGHLTDSWFDWRAVIKTALSLPEYEFRIIGHGLPDRLKGNLPENIKFFGPMDHADFVHESREWSVGLIPFKSSPLTFGVDPNKLYEYLALGVRVVSAPMGSVENAPLTTVYRSVDELKSQIVQQSNSRISAQEIRELEAYLAKSRWSYRGEEMMNIFKEVSDV